MRKNNLVEGKGLSISQAQSISNLCNQRAGEISVTLKKVNNCKKTIKVDGDDHLIQKGYVLPDDIVEMLKEKATLHACQAFLMENLKAKDELLKEMNNTKADISSVEFPIEPSNDFPYHSELLAEIGEEWGWEQLTNSEINEFFEAEAYASHIGQFIHQNGKLDQLRKELPNIPEIEWKVIEEGKKTPIKVETHHESKDLLDHHEKLAAEHRKYEQRVNYFKSKVKNLVTKESARIAKHNADLQIKAENEFKKTRAKYERLYNEANEKVKTIQAEFEKERQDKISKIASMRIDIDSRFQKTIDQFLNDIKEEKSE